MLLLRLGLQKGDRIFRYLPTQTQHAGSRGAGALLLCGRGKPLPVGPLRPGDPPLPVCARPLPRPRQGRQLVSDRLLLLLSPAASLGPGLLPRSRILLRHISQLSRPASETPADGTHDARLAARDRPQAPAKDFLPTPPRADYRLPQDRGRHIIYSFYRQASSFTNRTTTSRRRAKTTTGRTATGGKPSTEGKATGRKATTSRKTTTGRALTRKKPQQEEKLQQEEKHQQKAQKAID